MRSALLVLCTFTRKAPEGTSLDFCLAGSQSMPRASLSVTIQLLSSFTAFVDYFQLSANMRFCQAYSIYGYHRRLLNWMNKIAWQIEDFILPSLNLNCVYNLSNEYPPVKNHTYWYLHNIYISMQSQQSSCNQHSLASDDE